MFDLTIAGVTVWWPGLVLLGLSIGCLTGMFGVGGGFLLTPCLNIFFGIPYPMAVGSDLMQIFVTGGASAWKHWRQKHVDPLLGLIMAGGALGGTELGVRLLKRLSFGGEVVINGHSLVFQDLMLSCLFLVLMTLVAIYILKETSGVADSKETTAQLAATLQSYHWPPVLRFPKSQINSLSLWIPLLSSFGVGILTGMMGVGGGFITFPLLVYVIGAPTVIAVGTSAFQILFSTGYGAYRHACQGHVDLILVGLLLCGSLLGVQLGVYATRFLGGLKIRRYFAYVMGLGILVILGDLLRKIIL